MTETTGTAGPRLRLARQARGFSQQQLAGMAGVSRQAVSAVEAGHSDPSLRVAFALAQALGMTVEELFGPADLAPPVAAIPVAPPEGPGGRVLLAPVGDDMKPVVAESKRLRARLAKIDNEYDEGIIDGRRWKAAKENNQAKLREIDKKLATRKGGAALGKIAESPDPAQA